MIVEQLKLIITNPRSIIPKLLMFVFKWHFQRFKILTFCKENRIFLPILFTHTFLDSVSKKIDFRQKLQKSLTKQTKEYVCITYVCSAYTSRWLCVKNVAYQLFSTFSKKAFCLVKWRNHVQKYSFFHWIYALNK